MSTAALHLDPGPDLGPGLGHGLGPGLGHGLGPGLLAGLPGAVRTATTTQEDGAGRLLPTDPGLRDLLGGGLRRGTTYAVEGSLSLALAMAAGPSRAGGWCGVVGLPSFGSQAAAGAGVDLARVALVPEPGPQWLEVVAALTDAMDVVLVRPPTRPKDTDARRLAARLRRSGSSVVVVGPHPWPGCELRLAVTSSDWLGPGGDGHGHLSARTAVVSTTGRGSAGLPATTRMWLPGPDGGVAPVAPAAAARETRPTLRSVG